MIRKDHASSGQEPELNVVIAAYLKAVESGAAPNRKAWLARYPQLATQLEDFFASQPQVDKRDEAPGYAPTEAYVCPTTDYRAPDTPHAQPEAARAGRIGVPRERIAVGTVLARNSLVLSPCLGEPSVSC